MIGEDSEQIGVIDLDEAKRRARDAGLDLVEVSPNSTPPVCRIMDYGKWKYQQRKKEQKARSNSKTSELREVRLRPKIDDHDLNIKLNKARDFLSENDKVQFTLLFKGREMAHRDLGMDLMMSVKEKLSDLSKVETEPRQQGRRMTMVLAPGKKPSSPKPGKSPAPQGEGLGIPMSAVTEPAREEQPAATPADSDTAAPTPAGEPDPN